jgi:hypothetical protein
MQVQPATRALRAISVPKVFKASRVTRVKPARQVLMGQPVLKA